jgi:Spy/CpxP family protein refolding chaperone
MSRFLASVLGAALLWCVPAAATARECAHEQAGQKADQGAPKGASAAAKPGDARPSDTRRDPWWKGAETRAQLGLSDQQSKEIDDIFQTTRPQLLAGKDELDKLDDAVSKAMKEGTGDLESVKRLVGQLEQARARLNTTRTMMLYRMNQVLSRDQRVKLKAMFEQWDAERRKDKHDNK